MEAAGGVDLDKRKRGIGNAKQVGAVSFLILG
jgi:hypothetical protein